MDKADKIKLLIEFTSVSTDLQSAFRTKVDELPIYGEEEDILRLKDRVLDKINKKYEQFTEKQVSVYDKLLSEEALDASIEFYTSETGQEILAAMPKINEALTKLGIELSKQIMSELSDLIDSKDEDDLI
jgi:hypothetical protein